MGQDIINNDTAAASSDMKADAFFVYYFKSLA